MMSARRSYTPGYWAKNPDFKQTEAAGQDEKSGSKPGISIAPAFDIVTMRGQLLLRDGETASSTTTHPMTGEVTKLEITLNVVK